MFGIARIALVILAIAMLAMALNSPTFQYGIMFIMLALIAIYVFVVI
mgnify:CR=1 FL=1